MYSHAPFVSSGNTGSHPVVAPYRKYSYIHTNSLGFWQNSTQGKGLSTKKNLETREYIFSFLLCDKCYHEVKLLISYKNENSFVRIVFFHIHIKIHLGIPVNWIRPKVFACKYMILFYFYQITSTTNEFR